jgi:hypothetical protein
VVSLLCNKGHLKKKIFSQIFFIVSKLENLGKLRHDSEVRGPCQLSAFNDDAKIRRSFESRLDLKIIRFLFGVEHKKK